MVRARYWRQLRNGKIRCELCPRACELQDGQRGLCFVRARRGAELVLTTYGRSSGFCVDPIEKKPLNHFLPGTPILSFGTAGCNLTCKFCQNWDISKSREVETLSDQALPEQLARAAVDLGCRSVAFTYNDPIVFLEYAVDTAAACRELGVLTVAVTAGYVCPEPRIEFFSVIDAANVDLKAFNAAFYRRLCGAELEAVKDTLMFLRHETSVWFEVTTLLIPGENDSPAELESLCSWVAAELGPDTPIHFTAFHPAFRMLQHAATPASVLTRARDTAQAAGLRYAYTGNVHDAAGGSTYCGGCGQVVVERDWYLISAYHLTDQGDCRFCGVRCPGYFNGPAGGWGRRREPVRLGRFTN